MTTTSQPAAYSPISSDTIDTITISGTDTIDFSSLTTTDTSNSITYVSSPSSYTYSTSGTITFPSISTVQIGAITSIDTSAFTFNIRNATTSANVASVPATLVAGKIYTIVIRGFATPPTNNVNALGATLITNK